MSDSEIKNQINYLNDLKRDIHKYKTGNENLAEINRTIKRFESLIKEVSSK